MVFMPQVQSKQSALESFVRAAASCRSQCVPPSFVTDVVDAPGVYVFGELLNVAQVQALRDSEATKAHFELLSVFAYGTYGDYLARQTALPAISDAATTKLRQLTIVAAASSDKNLSYSTLLEQLRLKNVRELEDLIIDAIYNGLIDGKLDQKNSKLIVKCCIGRDVLPDDIDKLTTGLTEWCNRCQFLLATIEDLMKQSNEITMTAAREKERIDQEFTNIKKTLKVTSSPSMS